MLEGHVLRELLTPDLKATQFFAFHEVFHGVTAPGFLFGAGFTFAIATQRRWEESRTFSPGFFRRIWRAVLLVLIGYALHIPFLSLQKTLATASIVQWNAFFVFDVLQCIGFCLLAMRLFLILLRREQVFLTVLLALLFAFVYATPMFWTERAQQSMPLIISSAINGLTGSPFPLFPYSGFLIAGTCVSWLFLRVGQDKPQELFMKWLMLAGVLLIGIGTFLEAVPVQTYIYDNFWSTSPNYFWIRLGILLFMLGALWYIEDFFSLHSKSIIWMPKWTDRYDIVAKVPSRGPLGPPTDLDAIGPPLLALLADRFKLKYHEEERQVNAYSLVATKPKLKKADPANRTSCKNGDAPRRAGGNACVRL